MNPAFEDLVRQELGDAAAKTLATVLANVKLAPFLITNYQGQIDLKGSLAAIGEFLDGKRKAGEVVRPVSELILGMLRRLNLRTVPRKEVLEHTQTPDGLPEALSQAAEMKASYGLLLAGFNVNVPELQRQSQDLIDLMELEAAAETLHRALLFGRVALANAAADNLRLNFGQVRSLVAAQVPDTSWALIHRYLYRPAEEAAERAKENQARDARTEERVTDALLKKEEGKRELDGLNDKLHDTRLLREGDDKKK